MAINEITSIDVKTLPPFKRLIMTLGELPTSYLESMTYAELLMWFCNFLQEKVLPTINNNADALQEVIKYLENLDLQDEVNNKLDEMAESGQLQEIVADYLNSKAIFGYDKVTDMKEATNLIDGSYAKTLGYYSINDGGSGLYKIRKITNDDIIDNAFIISLSDNDLIAELITNNEIKINSLGAKVNDNTFDNSILIKKAIDKLLSLGGGKIVFNNGLYHCNTSIEYTELRGITLEGIFNTVDGTILQYNGNSTFIDVSTEISQCKFLNLTIQGDENNTNNTLGINFAKCNQTLFEYVRFRMFKTLAKLDDFGYTVFNYCQFFCNENCELGFKIGNTYSEFLYFNQCQFDGGYQENTTPILVKLNQGRYVYFNECDFTNTRDYAIYIQPQNGNLKEVYFDKCTFSHILKGIKIGSDVSTEYNHIQDIFFTNCLYELDGLTTENVFEMNNLSNSWERQISITDLSLLSFNASNAPAYIFKCNNNAIPIELDFTVKRTNLTLSQMNFSYPWNSYINIKLPEKTLRTYGRVVINGNGGTEYTVNLASNSPYSYGLATAVTVSDNTNKQYNAWVTSTLNGNIVLHVTFTEALASDSSVGLFYKINTQPCYAFN